MIPKVEVTDKVIVTFNKSVIVTKKNNATLTSALNRVIHPM